MLALLMAIACPVIWYFIGRHDGYDRGYARGAADKRKQLVDGMDNLLYAGLIRVQIRRDAVVDPPGTDQWVAVEGLHVANASETKH
jgi:hypothetical protein